MNIYLNPAGIGNATQVAGWLEWAAFVLDLRTSMDATYAGTTTATTPPAESILVRMATAEEWAAEGHSVTAPNASTRAGLGGTALTLLNPHIPPSDPAYEDLIVHELGHALGYGGHSADPDDLMHPYVNADSFPLTTGDMNGFIPFLSSRYPSVDVADKTSAIRSSNGDLWIPDINGNQAHLDYIEGSPSNAPRFLIESMVVNEESTGAYHTEYGSVTIPVHSMGPGYMVTLTVVGSEVHVTNAYVI